MMSSPEAEPAQPDSPRSDSSRAATGSRRTYPIGPTVLLAVAAAALWGSSRLTWVTLVSSDGLTMPRTSTLNGGVWFGALTPLSLVLVAAVAAVLATRGWLRRLVGIVVAVLAAVAAVPGFALLIGRGRPDERAATLAELPARAQVDQVTTAPLPAVLSLVGAVAAFVAGVALTRMPAHTARLSGKYDNPVFRRAAAADEVAALRAQQADTAGTKDGPADGESGAAARAEPGTAAGSAAAQPDQRSERVLWDALDAGSDPTADEPGR